MSFDQNGTYIPAYSSHLSDRSTVTILSSRKEAYLDWRGSGDACCRSCRIDGLHRRSLALVDLTFFLCHSSLLQAVLLRSEIRVTLPLCWSSSLHKPTLRMI